MKDVSRQSSDTNISGKALAEGEVAHFTFQGSSVDKGKAVGGSTAVREKNLKIKGGSSSPKRRGRPPGSGTKATAQKLLQLLRLLSPLLVILKNVWGRLLLGRGLCLRSRGWRIWIARYRRIFPQL